jgi:hypothetical protein
MFLRGYRARAKLDLPRMAAELETDPERLRLVEVGRAFPPPAERDRWAKRLGFENWLALDAEWRDVEPPRGLLPDEGKVAIVNKAPAGDPEDYEEYGLHSGVGHDYADIPPGFEGATLFAFIVVGHSMSGGYEPDDLVYCRPVRMEEKLPAGSAVFVRFGAAWDNRCTFKLLFPAERDDFVELRPINPAYKILRAARADIAGLGLAVYRVPGYYVSLREPRLIRDQYAQTFPED